MRRFGVLIAMLLTLPTGVAMASEAGSAINGTELSLFWIIPFVGMLLSIALCPLFTPHLWEHHFGKIAAGWSVALIVPTLAILGSDALVNALLHMVLTEYLPFIILLFALFVVAGGIRISGNLIGDPATNTGILAIGAMMASFIGTTGASMVLIRPMIRANQDRKHNVHVFIFFIFLVSNIGGSLTPLGDPPLFLGFLKGVDFLWTMEHMLPPLLVAVFVLLGMFYFLDQLAWRKEDHEILREGRTERRIQIEGLVNVLLLAAIIGAVLLSGLWNPGVSVPIVKGHSVPLQGLMRDAILLVISWVSWKFTRQSIRVENVFTWAPMQEVAYLFAGIFITMIPALEILRAGSHGAMAPLVSLVSGADGQPVNAAYFWLTGILSSFLDNAPTYLVFFNLAGGDAQHLMGPMANTLLAISAGAVFMGANSYIGNAPNFMVKSICEERGIRMPSFFGYMAWSCAILLPLFVLVTWIYFL